jgi:hypothetical protein
MKTVSGMANSKPLIRYLTGVGSYTTPLDCQFIYVQSIIGTYSAGYYDVGMHSYNGGASTFDGKLIDGVVKVGKNGLIIVSEYY